MSGHSKWAQIKHKKAGTDAKRGAAFSKLARMVSVAAREGGGSPEANPKLRQIMDQAKDAGLPRENIERAIARGVGGGDAESLKAVEYEAYGPGRSALLVSGLTDSPNRTTNEVKHLLEEHGGRLAGSGSVGWMFERRIQFEFGLAGKSPEESELALIDAGAEDTVIERERLLALVPAEQAEAFQKKLGSSFTSIRSSVVVAPKTFVSLSPSDYTRAVVLIEVLRGHPDITEVITNIDTDL